MGKIRSKRCKDENNKKYLSNNLSIINNDNYYKCIIVTEPMYDYDHCTSFIFNKMFYL